MFLLTSSLATLPFLPFLKLPTISNFMVYLDASHANDLCKDAPPQAMHSSLPVVLSPDIAPKHNPSP
jgi:hypothetical protein